MKAIDRAKSHCENLSVKKISVPEWAEDGKPFYLFASPLTLQETSKLYKMSKDDDMTMLVYILIYKALDEDGNKLFTLEDKSTLLNKVDRNVIARVANEIMGNTPIEEVKKN